jgi:ABC-2 type transport system permease protein
MYTSNLRRLGYDLQNPFWTLVISHLNLLVCCLALSTLTTRFVFPQFSMEGQRLWILGLSPLPLVKVLSLKLRLIAGVLALLTTLLVVMSSLSLELPLMRSAFFCAAVIMLSYGLTALSLALGAILPNFREPNPARVISGFGGTLCLIGSFLYILGSSAALAIPDAVAWRAGLQKMPLSPREMMIGELSALGFVGFLTLLFGGVPWWLAKKRTKNLDYLKEL